MKNHEKDGSRFRNLPGTYRRYAAVERGGESFPRLFAANISGKIPPLDLGPRNTEVTGQVTSVARNFLTSSGTAFDKFGTARQNSQRISASSAGLSARNNGFEFFSAGWGRASP